MSAIGRSSSGVRDWEWAVVVGLLLLAWALRLCCLEEVPPGWRDDELINIHSLSSRLLRGEFPIYYLGASGHEPLYHHLHAGVHALLGFNVLSGHILSVAFGTLSVALIYSLVRRLFSSQRSVAVIAALALAMSFWSLMYSRTAIRHISLVPLALGALYAFWRRIDAPESPVWTWVPVGLLLGATLYTYTASRLLPVLLVAFAVYLALVHSDLCHRHWRGMALALAVMGMLAAPLALAIVEGRTQRAVEGIGADARVSELAKPLRELRDGNPRPLLWNTCTTLGMFHATGDPEWLYNIPGRPVFGLLGGALFWAGVAICVYRWRRPRCFFLLLWLVAGLSPAFVSIPAASLSHTILAQPVAYILPALTLSQLHRWLSSTPRETPLHQLSFVARPIRLVLWWGLAIVFLATTAVRDLRDYFLVWPEQDMVRILYRADYRAAADYLNSHPELDDVALGSALLGPWDRLALRVDAERDDLSARLFNPERALVWTDRDATSVALLTSWPTPTAPINAFLQESDDLTVDIHSRVRKHRLGSLEAGSDPPLAHFANGLMLMEAEWLRSLIPDDEVWLLTSWYVAGPLDLPPMPIVANPPPPGVYAGPRLKVFAHLVSADGSQADVDDGLWVDPLTLRPGDRFVQIHRFDVPSKVVDLSYRVELGLYDPKTGQRWEVRNGGDQPLLDRVIVE